MATRTCPKCQTERPIQHFRRWRGAFRVLHQTCNICDPEVSLIDVRDPTQRQHIAHIRNLTRNQLDSAQQRRDSQAQRKRERVSRAALARHRKERHRAWDEAIVARVRDERDFSRRKLAVLHAQHAHYTLPPDDPRKQHASNAQRHHAQRLEYYNAHTWIPFYTAYVEILNRVYEQLKIKKRTIGEKLQPTEEEAELGYWIPPNEVQKLRSLYSQGVIPRGARFRTPLIIRKPEAKNGGKPTPKSGGNEDE